MSYLNLFSNCIFVKGVKSSALCDLQMNNFYMVPNDMGDVLKFLSKNSVEECFTYFDLSNKNTIQSYIDFIVKKELGFLDSSLLDELIPLSFDWDTYTDITNVIIEFNNTVDYNTHFFDQLKSSNVEAIEIRVYNEVNLSMLESFLINFADSTLQSIRLVLPFFTNIKRVVNSLVKKHIRINSILIHSSPRNEHIKIFDDSINVFFIMKKINSCLGCGVIHPNYFSSNIKLFSESQSYNSCLNKKVAIDIDGNIRNCPSMPQTFGNIKHTTLEEALHHKDFKKYWNLTKDKIEVCKDCEFRYICTDCRAYTERTHEDKEGLDISKPLKCGYDPYTGEWKEWSTNPLKEKAIKYYGMQELVKKN